MESVRQLDRQCYASAAKLLAQTNPCHVYMCPTRRPAWPSWNGFSAQTFACTSKRIAKPASAWGRTLRRVVSELDHAAPVRRVIRLAHS